MWTISSLLADIGYGLLHKIPKLGAAEGEVALDQHNIQEDMDAEILHTFGEEDSPVSEEGSAPESVQPRSESIL